MDEKESKEKQEYEEDLQRRLKILKQKMEEGKIRLPNDPHIKESLLAVRYGPDGKVDLKTVNGCVRSLSLAVTFWHDREETKKAMPLRQIQEMYFQFIENNFGKYFEIMRKRKLPPHDVGVALTQNPSVLDSMSKTIPKFMESIDDFWKITEKATYAHIEDMPGMLKGVFGGDLFPSYTENIASKCGIYADTIILPDPFMRQKPLIGKLSPEDQVYYFFKHAVNLLQYKDLALAELDKPIVVIVPDRIDFKENEKPFYLKVAEDDAVIHVGKIFGRSFESFEDVMQFVQRLDTPEKLLHEVKDEERLLFDTEWKGSIQQKLSMVMKDRHTRILGTNHPGIITASEAIGRMATSNELLLKARRLGAIPIIDAPTSWQYFIWKLEYDAHRAEQKNDFKNLHVLRALQSSRNDEMEWIGRIPSDALIEIRKSGALDEIRDILGKGVSELVICNPADFNQTTDKVLANIHEAFENHKKRIKELRRKKWKFAGKDIGTWLVVGTLEITAAATGYPIWGLAAIAANQLTDAPKLKDIPDSVRKLAKESKKLRHCPVGMLFKYKKKKV